MRLCNIYNKEINKKKKERDVFRPARAPNAHVVRVLHVFEGHVVPMYVIIIYIYCLYVIHVFNDSLHFVIYPSRV